MSKHVVTVETRAPIAWEYYYDSRNGVEKAKIDDRVGQIHMAECSCGEEFSSVHGVTSHLEGVYDE